MKQLYFNQNHFLEKNNFLKELKKEIETEGGLGDSVEAELLFTTGHPFFQSTLSNNKTLP